jgi:hypothetical protein
MDLSDLLLAILVALELAVAMLAIRAPVEVRLSLTLGQDSSGIGMRAWYGPFLVTAGRGKGTAGQGLQLQFAGRNVPVPQVSGVHRKVVVPGSRVLPGAGAGEEPWSKGVIRLFQAVLPHLPGMVWALFRWSRRVLRMTTSWDGSLHISGGFDDPALTGMVYGTVAAMRPVLKTCRFDLSMVPVFNGPGIDIGASARIRIRYPVIVLLSLPSLVTDRAVLNGIRALRSYRAGTRMVVACAAPGGAACP